MKPMNLKLSFAIGESRKSNEPTYPRIWFYICVPYIRASAALINKCLRKVVDHLNVF